MDNEFKDIMENLEAEILHFKEVFKHINDTVKEFEGGMRSQGGYIPFKMKVMDEYAFEYEPGKTGIYSAHLQIRRCPASGNMRLFLYLENNDMESFLRVFMELPVPLRIQFFQYIKPFIREYTKYLSQYRASFRIEGL